MTLACFRVHPDHVDIVTDSMQTSANLREIGFMRKVALLAPHLDTAVLSIGNTLMGAMWDMSLTTRALHLKSFDELTDYAAEGLPAIWGRLCESNWGTLAHERPDVVETHVFHLGYSPRRGGFVAVAFRSADGFQPEEHPGTLVSPEPATPEPAGEPDSDDEWVALAERLYRERSLAPVASGQKITLGGAILRTHLEQGAVHERVIRRFPTDDEELGRLFADSAHPTSQLSACVCGSGNVTVLCHWHAPDSACTCNSGKTFGECCRVPDDDIDQAQKALDMQRVIAQHQADASPGTTGGPKVGRNDPCPCGSGRKLKRCCAA